jgi:hypothetical protein
VNPTSGVKINGADDEVTKWHMKKGCKDFNWPHRLLTPVD